MIDIPKVKVLRYTEEEFRRMKPPVGTVPEGADWFSPQVEKEYSKYKVLKTFFDYENGYVYVIMSKANFDVVQKVKKMLSGGVMLPYMEEEVILHETS